MPKILLLFFSFIVSVKPIFAENEKVKIAVFGDSVSAGSFATEPMLYPTVFRCFIIFDR